MLMLIGYVCLVLGVTIACYGDLNDSSYKSMLSFVIALFAITIFGITTGIDATSKAIGEIAIFNIQDKTGIIQVDTEKLETLSKSEYDSLDAIEKKIVDHMRKKIEKSI